MTENEAIKVIETEKQCVLRNNENRCDRDCICCDLVMAENDIILGYDMATKSLKEIQQYREIGTVEECREARERQRAKKVVISHNGCVKDNGKAFCHNCGLDIHGKGMVGHCFRCGQAIDWSDSD